MYVRQLLVLLAALLVTACAAPGPSQPPVALVIGNGAYNGTVPALPNPEHDARAVAERLQSSGYKTVLLLDANRLEMTEAIRTFAQLATGAPLSVVYYSGHGVEINGRNYLLPVDFQIGSEGEVPNLEDKALPVAEVDRLVGGRANGTLILLDACRTDPGSPAPNGGDGSRRLRSIQGAGKGLAGEQPALSTIIYATTPGETALDGDGEFSPFTFSVLQLIDLPTTWNYKTSTFPFLPLLRLSVRDATNGQQTPTWLGPPITALGRYSSGLAGPAVQQILTKVHSDPPTGVVGTLPSVSIPTAINEAAKCTVTMPLFQPWRIRTGANTTLCGRLAGGPGTSISITQQPKHGHVATDGAAFGYTPDRNYTGTDTFGLIISEYGTADRKTVLVTVAPAKRPASNAAQ